MGALRRFDAEMRCIDAFGACNGALASPRFVRSRPCFGWGVLGTTRAVVVPAGHYQQGHRGAPIPLSHCRSSFRLASTILPVPKTSGETPRLAFCVSVPEETCPYWLNRLSPKACGLQPPCLRLTEAVLKDFYGVEDGDDAIIYSRIIE